MGDLPWDLVYYGSMAIIFVGIIAASRKARKARRDAERRQGDARRGASVHKGDDV